MRLAAALLLLLLGCGSSREPAPASDPPPAKRIEPAAAKTETPAKPGADAAPQREDPRVEIERQIKRAEEAAATAKSKSELDAARAEIARLRKLEDESVEETEAVCNPDDPLCTAPLQKPKPTAAKPAPAREIERGRARRRGKPASRFEHTCTIPVCRMNRPFGACE